MTDHTLAARQRAARNYITCPLCNQPPSKPCKDAGAVVSPHPGRLAEADTWFAGYDFAVREGGLKTQLTNALHDLDVAGDQVGTLTDDVRDAMRRVNVAEDNAANLAEQLKTARIGAALVPGLQQQVADLRARIAELENPDPEPERLPFGIGTVEKAASSAFPMLFTPTALETAAGVKFTYMHEYFRFGTSGVLTSLVSWCEVQLKAGRIPIPTAKVAGDDWVGAAAGKYNATIGATVDALEALAVKYGSRVIMGIAHEPNNDGKPLADFLAMTRTLLPIVKRPGRVEYWINLTGYAQLYEDTDWTLDACYVEGVDGYAFNPYLSLGASSSKLTSQRTGYYEKFAAWAKGKGVQWGIWETGINENAAVSTLPGVKTWIPDCAAAAAELGATMWIYWNNRVSAEKQDWRISKTLPADKHGQLVAAMKKYART